MRFFNENKNNSYVFSSKRFLSNYPTCAPCCTFDSKDVFYPTMNHLLTTENAQIAKNSDTCCLNKLQVDCRIQCYKKKRKYEKMMKNIRYNSTNIKQSISASSNQLNSNHKRKKFDAIVNANSHYINNYDLNNQTSLSSFSTLPHTNESQISERTFSSTKFEGSQTALYMNQNIQDLKNSIDNLKSLIVQQNNSSQIPSISKLFFDKFSQFFNLFKYSSKSPKHSINDECIRILENNHLKKENLLSIYHLYDKNEAIFQNWLRTFMPDYLLPLLLNYVKHFDSISTDKE